MFKLTFGTDVWYDTLRRKKNPPLQPCEKVPSNRKGPDLPSGRSIIASGNRCASAAHHKQRELPYRGVGPFAYPIHHELSRGYLACSLFRFESRLHLLVQYGDHRPGFVLDALSELRSFFALLKQLIRNVQGREHGEAWCGDRLRRALDLLQAIVYVRGELLDVSLISIASNDVTLPTHVNDNRSFSHKPYHFE